jgi:hypothetical protein
METSTTVMGAIKTFFSTVDRPVTFTELKALTQADRDELGTLCANALGMTLKEVEA